MNRLTTKAKILFAVIIGGVVAYLFSALGIEDYRVVKVSQPTLIPSITAVPTQAPTQVPTQVPTASPTATLYYQPVQQPVANPTQ